jgi:uncharacterized membrane protein YfcA
MVYLPIAGQVLGPFQALTTLVVMDLVGPLPNVPKAWKDAAPSELARLGLGLLLFLPLGLWVLSIASEAFFRYAVSSVSLILLVILITGRRYRGELTPRLLYGTGAIAGFLGGVSGLAGPPVILLYVASAQAVAVIRANTLLFLLLTDVLFLGVLALTGRLDGSAVSLGALLIPVYLLANVAGAAIFNPRYERLYRGVAYGIIALSALLGLPLWDR